MRLFSCSLSVTRTKDIESAEPTPTHENDMEETLNNYQNKNTTILPIPVEEYGEKTHPPPMPEPLPAEQIKIREFLDEYDPRPVDTSIIPALFPMSQHRRMMRTLYLDNILNATARLHRHSWILGARNEKFAGLQTKERWDEIHNDLMRYTKAIKAYEFWRSSIIRKMELERKAIPPDFETYGRTLAILECASQDIGGLEPDKQYAIANISHSLISSHAQWSHLESNNRSLRERFIKAQSKKRALLSRMIAATFGGLTLIVPMLIMVLDQRKLTTVLTTSLFTLAIGLILAIWMKDAHNKDILAATAAYAAVLVVFVGSGANVPV